MSEYSISLVRLDIVPDSAIETIAGVIRDWLLERGIIVANDRLDSLSQPSAWKPGPRARDVADTSWFDVFLRGTNNGVDIATQRDCYPANENEEPPLCRLCSAPAPSVYHDDGEWVGKWLDEATEPTFTCVACGWAAPVGDWVGEFSVVVGVPAIKFFNWPDLDAGFIADARARLGGRTAVVRSHW